MTIPFFRRVFPPRRHSCRGVPRELPPHLMRDIGLEPWPERPRLNLHALW